MAEQAASLLRQARRRTGMSQTELARRADVTQSVISAYENGRREPGLGTLAKLVEASGHRLVVDVVSGTGEVRGLPNTPMGRRLRRRRRAVVQAASQHGATNVRLFGSVARGEDTEASDVDLLVDLRSHVGLVELAALERELQAILRRPVDVVPASTAKASALAEAIPL